MMRNLRVLKVDRETGVLVDDPVQHDRENCTKSQKGQRDHAFWDWQKALEVKFYEKEPSYGPPVIVGVVIGIILSRMFL